MLTDKAEKILKRNAYDVAGHCNLMHGKLLAEVFGKKLDNLTFDSFWDANNYAVECTKKELNEEDDDSLSFGMVVFHYMKKHPEMTIRKENALVRELTRNLIENFGKRAGLLE
jgi:hypothetical protein